MFLFSQLVLIGVTLIIPLIVFTIYGYVKRQGWKPISWGILDSILVLFLVRMVLPLLFLDQSWFTAMLSNTLLYVCVYSLFMALGYNSFAYFYFYRLEKRNPNIDEGKGFIFGASQGFAYEAIFIGFNALSSLLSDFSPDVDTSQVGGLWLSMIESAAMIILFGLFAFQIQKAQKEKNWLLLLISFLETFVFFFLGFSWQAIWNLPRFLLELILIIASGLAFWMLKRQGIFAHLFSMEIEDPIQEEPTLSTREILEKRQKS